MDWSLALVVAVVLFLALHMALDLRTLASQVRGLRHDDGVPAGMPGECPVCRTILRGKQALRHEAMWTAAAVVVLTIHIVLDFVG